MLSFCALRLRVAARRAGSVSESMHPQAPNADGSCNFVQDDRSRIHRRRRTQNMQKLLTPMDPATSLRSRRVTGRGCHSARLRAPPSSFCAHAEIGEIGDRPRFSCGRDESRPYAVTPRPSAVILRPAPPRCCAQGRLRRKIHASASPQRRWILQLRAG